MTTPPFEDRPPADDRVTAYDERHFVTYLRLLDAAEEGADWREVAELMAARSTLSTSDVIGVLTGLQDAVLHFNLRGRGVKLEGLGTYLPNINYQGELDVAPASTDVLNAR